MSVDTNLMEVPAGEPEVRGDYFVWVDNGEASTVRVSRVVSWAIRSKLCVAILSLHFQRAFNSSCDRLLNHERISVA